MIKRIRRHAMSWNLRAELTALLALGLVGCLGDVSQGAYVNGFVWDRSVDYNEGVTAGLTTGNPNADAEGNAVWSIESTNSSGDGLGGASPWYQGSTTLHVWDDSWFGGPGAWTRGDNVNPPIRGTSMTTNISNAGLHATIPLIRWINPLSHPMQMDIGGSLKLNWRGPGPNTSANVDYDVVIAQVHASNGATSVLYGAVFEKPTDDTSWESLTKPVSLSGIWVMPGDEILISPRAHGPSTTGSAWPSLEDNLTLSATAIVPEPTTMFIWAVLTFCASMGAGRWGRRRQLGGSGGGRMRDRASARVRRPWTPEQRGAIVAIIERGRHCPPRSDWADADSSW